MSVAGSRPARLPALPPGPRQSVLAQTVGFHRDPLGYLRRARDSHGGVFTLRLLTVRPLVVAAGPEAAEALLVADPGRARAGEARRRILPFASARSVFGADDEAHRAARSRIAPALSEAAIAARRPAMAALAARHASSWPRQRPFRLLARTRQLCDEIFVRLVLGVRGEQLAAELIAAVRRLLRTPGNPPATLPGPGDGLAGALGRELFEWRQRAAVAALTRAVEARRAEADGPREGLPPDVLGCVAGDTELRAEAIVAELMSLLMAAQEPPAIALGRLLERSGLDPEAGERLRREPGGGFARAFVQETLRLHPPASAALRRLAEPAPVGEALLPAGAAVMVPTSLLQRDRRYERADEFVPERWLGDAPPPAPYFPFGGGARRCVGEQLAWAEIETVLPAVLAKRRIAPLSPEPEPMVQRATVLAPKRGLLVRAPARP